MTLARRDHDNEIVKGRINRGEFYAIPADLKSRSYTERNPWPPKQFKCGRCGLQYDGLVPRHDCSDGGSYHADVLMYDFCTHCGDTFNPYDGRHTCEPYGKHARRVELPNSTTFYVRVFSIGSNGRHHYDPNSKLSYVWVQNLTGPSGFRYVGWAKGIERACLIMGIKPDPYFTIDGIRISDSGGNIIHREYRHRNMPCEVVPVIEKLCSPSDLDPEWCVTHRKNWKDHDDRCNECGDELENPEFDLCPACYVPHCEVCGGPHEHWEC